MTTLQAWRRQMAMLGYAVTGSFRGGEHALWACEDRWSQGGAIWDHGDHLPWLVISQTPCLVEDLGQPEPAPDPVRANSAPVRHTCRLRHIHYGPRPRTET